MKVIPDSVNKKFTNNIKVETERGHKTTTLHAGMPEPAGHRFYPPLQPRPVPSSSAQVDQHYT